MKASTFIAYALVVAVASCDTRTESEKIDATVKRLVMAVHDSDYTTFRKYIASMIENKIESEEGIRFKFINLHWAVKKYLNTDYKSLKYSIVETPHKAAYTSTATVPVFSGNGTIDSCSGLKSMSVDLYFNPATIGYDKLMGFDINSEYDANYREYLFKNHLLCDDTPADQYLD